MSFVNVEFTLTVTDTQAGKAQTYFNSQGQQANAANIDEF